ncbi:hypothetical protein F4802DRAFT_583837 [Xylaria palmicola]|nr:hypothetical protein F4802DRAFT_583837 [Xylaria palmicola]
MVAGTRVDPSSCQYSGHRQNTLFPPFLICSNCRGAEIDHGLRRHTMQRRSAKKSRLGCKECKRRHVKCDETRPSCANCNVRQLPCSFVTTVAHRIPRRPATAAIVPSPGPEAASSSVSDPCDEPGRGGHAKPPHHTPASTTTSLSLVRPSLTVDSIVATGQTFKLHHLELLHNFRTDVIGGHLLDFGAIERYMNMAVAAAAQAPYLMDQVLALSAANMSAKRPHQRRFYRDEATHLQTRGLSLFNAAACTDVNDAFAGFVFSTLLSQQVLFDAFSTRTDFAAFLDSLTAALHISGGVRVVSSRSWPFILAQYRDQAGMSMPNDFVPDSGVVTLFTVKLCQLEALLVGANLSPSVSDPCKKALQFLRELSFDTSLNPPRFCAFRRTRIIHWAVITPTDFVKLLEQRQPEALVIVAYYALILHDTREYWLCGDDTGAFIIRSITGFLGKRWAGWLAWPNEVIDSVDSPHEIQPFSQIDIDTQNIIDYLA